MFNFSVNHLSLLSRTECRKWSLAGRMPNTELFFSLAGARQKLERWQQDYNQSRPYSALD